MAATTRVNGFKEEQVRGANTDASINNSNERHSCFTILFSIYNWQPRWREGDVRRLRKINYFCIPIMVFCISLTVVNAKITTILALENQEMQKVMAKLEIIDKMSYDQQLSALVEIPLRQLGMIPTKKRG